MNITFGFYVPMRLGTRFAQTSIILTFVIHTVQFKKTNQTEILSDRMKKYICSVIFYINAGNIYKNYS